MAVVRDSPQLHGGAVEDVRFGPGEVRAEFVPGLEGLAAFADDWERIFVTAPNEPSTSLEWTRALLRHRTREYRPVGVIRVQRGGVTVGLVPLLARTSYVLRRPWVILRPASELKSTHSDLLLAERSPEVADALVDALAQIPTPWDGFRLSKLLPDNPLGGLLSAAASRRRWPVKARISRAAYHLALPSTYEAYFAQRSAKFRNHARRAEKKLLAAGLVRVIEVTHPAHFERAFDAVLSVERASWKHSHGTSLSVSESEAALYRDWGCTAASGRVHLQILMLDDVPVAYNLGTVDRGCYYYLKTSYAAEYRPLGPSTYLRLRLIESLIASGCTSVDFPGTPFEWERQWTETYRWQRVLSIHPRTIRGRILASLDRWAHHSEAGDAPQHADPRDQRTIE